jgi:hypothetical protein
MSDSAKYYKTLELPPGASLRRVKEQFRALAKAYHPDLYPYDSDYRDRCEDKMRRINEAYQYLRKFAPEEDEDAAQSTYGGAWGYKPDDPAQGRPQPGRRKTARPAPPPEPQQPPPYRPEPEPELTPGEPGIRPWDGRTASKAKWGPIRDVPKDEPDFPGLWQVTGGFLLAIASLVAIFFLPSPASNTYFETVRVITSVACIYGAYFSVARGSWEIALILILLAISLNPILPVRMSHEDWKIFNFIAPGGLAYAWFILFEREAKLAHRKAIQAKPKKKRAS